VSDTVADSVLFWYRVHSRWYSFNIAW